MIDKWHREFTFEIDDDAWLRGMFPEFSHMLDDGNTFKCTYTLIENEHGQSYRLRTSDGRTNYNDLTYYEKGCLESCKAYFDNRLQIVGTPDYCIKLTMFDGMFAPEHYTRR